MASLFRMFVPRFPKYAAPLFKFLRRVKKIVWTEEGENVFSTLYLVFNTRTLLV